MTNERIKEQLQERIINYEHWISSNCKGNPPQNIQKELFELHNESPDAYTFYRNYLWLLLIGTFEESDELLKFIEFLNYSKSNNGFNEIVNFYKTETSSSFDYKRMNAFETASEISSQGLSQVSCFLYQQYYEIETILLLLLSISILNTKGSIDIELKEFRDKSGRLRKGVAIDFIKAKLKNHQQLLSLFTSGYNTKLRNIIGHNNYRINGNFIECLDFKIKVSKSDFFKSLYNLQKMNNFLLYFFSSSSLKENDFKDNGFISIGFAEDNGECILVIYQLECFFNIDNEKEWFDRVIFTIENDVVRTTLPTKISTKPPMEGTYDEGMKEWLQKLENNNKLIVIFQSIRPQMNAEDNIIEIKHGNFAKCGNQIERTCDYEIKITP